MMRSLNQFEKLYSIIHFPVQLVDSSGVVAYINPAFSLVWGYTLTELSEYNIFNDAELIKSGNAEILKTVLADGKPAAITEYSDSLLKSRNIAIPLLLTKVSPLTIGKSDFLLLIHEDQTDLYLAEQEIRKARDAFRESERLKDTFLNVLSHELRTPLNSILGYASIIKESMKDKLSGEDKIYLENLHNGSERLFKSITQMLEFAQIEAGTYNLNMEKLDLVDIVKRGLHAINAPAKEKKIDIKTIFTTEQIMVDADLHSVENAVGNLLGNAVKFTHQGYIEVETSISRERNLAVCRIKDTGVGISADYMDHLFQPFSQEDLNIGRSYEGNGLGLALSKKYIEKLGGSLLVDSIKGVGTTITFTLPLAEPVKQKSDGQVKKKLRKILVLEDTAESYDLLNAYLKFGYELDVYSLRDFSLGLLNDDSYSMIIFDVHQSHWDQSIIICGDIKRNDPFKRPVIILSSEYIDEKIEKFHTAGADKFIVKPFSKDDLLKALDVFE